MATLRIDATLSLNLPGNIPGVILLDVRRKVENLVIDDPQVTELFTEIARDFLSKAGYETCLTCETFFPIKDLVDDECAACRAQRDEAPPA